MNDYRFEYLIRTLSRTKRKDYENYVINAVWNRLADHSIKPASQWYVKNDHGWHLIDLYFPQLNFGVECDESHHKHNQAADEQRELTLIEVLSAVNTHPYEAFHVDVTLPYAEIERRLDECVARIKELLNERRKAGEFQEWTDIDNKQYFKDKQGIHAGDDILFPTIVDAVNSLMKSDKKAYQKGYFTPAGLDPIYKFWFPQLEIEGKAAARGWHNILSEDGNTITEYNDDIEANLVRWEAASDKRFLNHIRVTFAKVRDPVTNKRAYKFVGLFKLKAIDGSNVRTYTRVSSSFDAAMHRITSKP